MATLISKSPETNSRIINLPILGKTMFDENNEAQIKDSLVESFMAIEHSMLFVIKGEESKTLTKKEVKKDKPTVEKPEISLSKEEKKAMLLKQLEELEKEESGDNTSPEQGTDITDKPPIDLTKLTYGELKILIKEYPVAETSGLTNKKAMLEFLQSKLTPKE